MRRLFALTLVLALVACAHASPLPGARSMATACKLEQRADLPLRNVRSFMLAPVSLNGSPATMVVDTGAETTTLTPEAAAALRLPPDAGRASVLRGVSGNVRSQNTHLRTIALDGVVVRTDASVGVGRMPRFPGVTPAVAGLLGIDVLAAYDVELDLPAGHMRLYAAHRCNLYLPWPGATPLPFEQRKSGLIFVDALVDGRAVRALVDTGARTTLLSRRTAVALGVTEATLANDVERSGVGIGMGSIAFRQHRFAELGVPGSLAHDITVNIADLNLPGVEMLLGADYLGPRRPWISFSTGRLFLH
jgi:predicted aspartyl protease